MKDAHAAPGTRQADFAELFTTPCQPSPEATGSHTSPQDTTVVPASTTEAKSGDDKQAVEARRLLAVLDLDPSNAEAMCDLGVCYQRGEGLPKDPFKVESEPRVSS